MKPKTLRNLAIALGILFLLGMPSLASADNLAWSLSVLPGNCDDGCSAFGSFVFNADTDTYSSIDVVTTVGTVLPGATYTVENAPFPFNGPGQVVIMANNSFLAGTPVLDMVFGTGLTDAGGVVTVNIAEGLCNAGCTAFELGGFRRMDGVVTSTEPSSVLLLGFGLFGLAGVARRKVMHA